MRRIGGGLVAIGIGVLVALGLGRTWDPASLPADAPVANPSIAATGEDAVAVHPAPDDVPGDARGPVFSPRGQYLAWEQVGPEGTSLRLGRLFDGTIREVIPVQAVDVGEGSSVSDPSWHPAPRLAFGVRTPDGVDRLYYALPKPEPGRPLLNPERFPGEAREPAMAPNGALVAWISDGDVHVWRRGGEGPVRLAETDAVERDPVISRDGTALLALRGPAGDAELIRLELDGGVRTVVAGGVAVAGWDHEGRIVAVVDDRVEVHDGSEVRVLARGVRAPSEAPGISEDGRWVAWVEGARPSVISVARIDGSERHDVETGRDEVGDPVIAQGFGRSIAAFTARDGARRRVFVADLTDRIGSGEGSGYDLQLPGQGGRVFRPPRRQADSN